MKARGLPRVVAGAISLSSQPPQNWELELHMGPGLPPGVAAGLQGKSPQSDGSCADAPP